MELTMTEGHMFSRKLAALGWFSLWLAPTLAVQAGAWEAGRLEARRESRTEVEQPIPFVLEGLVFETGGAPASGAVVVSGAGGKAITDSNGHYRLEIALHRGAQSVQVTAVGGAEGRHSASATVDLRAASSPLGVQPLELALASACQPSWLPTFGGEPGTNSPITAMAAFDDGSGPALYVGGAFSVAGGVPASGIARWDGTSWTPVDSGLQPTPAGGGARALLVFDDGSGPALYAGGHFDFAGGTPASNIGKWDGSSWTALGNGLVGGITDGVSALAVFDDGGGPALHAGGRFITAGGVPAQNIAKWDGTSWSSLGSGTNNDVAALAVFDDGKGSALFAGGSFTTAGGVGAKYLARWDGSSWAPIGSQMDDIVRALAVFDDGSGPALYAGGEFTRAGGSETSYLVRWDGSSWSAVGSGVNGKVYVLGVFDDGTGAALHAGGLFTQAGGVVVGRIAKWKGPTWATLGSGFGGFGVPLALAVFDAGNGPLLYAGGDFSSAGSVTAINIARWDGQDWSALGKGIGGTLTILGTTGIDAVIAYDGGSGPALLAGGEFTTAGGVGMTNLGRWDGATWIPVGGVLTARVKALAGFDSGNGAELYVGGGFPAGASATLRYIAKWDGSSWSELAGGVNGLPLAMTTFDDGSSDALYVGGLFSHAGALLVRGIARWDGSSWSALGSGVGDARALVVFDDGSGPALYAGGDFTSAGGVPANRVAKWDGSTWSALGSGVGTLSSHHVFALEVFDDGRGPALYVGGGFTTAGGAPANSIARWDGSSWEALGSGTSGQINALRVFDDGSGPKLHAGGTFTSIGGVAANRIAKWDGTSWSALGGGMDQPIQVLTTFDDGTGPALFAGGEFTATLDSGDSYLAKWGCRPPAKYRDLTPTTFSH